MMRYLSRMLCLTFFAVLLVGSFVSASFSVSNQYTENHPLVTEEEEVVSFFVRNVASESPIEIEADIVEGEGIASLVEEGRIYEIALGERVEVPVRVEAASADKGEYEVKVSFTQVSGDEGDGNVGFVTSITYTLPVVVGALEEAGGVGEETTSEEKPVKESPPVEAGKVLFWVGFVFLLSLVIVVTLLIFYLVRKNRREKGIM